MRKKQLVVEHRRGATLFTRDAYDIRPDKEYSATIRYKQPAGQLHFGRLATNRWTEERGEPALLHRAEVGPVDPDQVHVTPTCDTGLLLGQDQVHGIRRICEGHTVQRDSAVLLQRGTDHVRNLAVDRVRSAPHEEIHFSSAGHPDDAVPVGPDQCVAIGHIGMSPGRNDESKGERVASKKS